MYKVLLVEDEILVREAIRDIIDWTALGFCLVGEAENGKEALELIEDVFPDVVLTDIAMPFMDGLKLASCIKDKYPMTKVVIITGYGEFEYAQQAVKLSISDFVMKPATAEEFTKLMQKVKMELDRELAQKENMVRLRQQVAESRELILERFFNSLVQGCINKSELKAKLELFSLDLSGNCYLAAVLDLDDAESDRFEAVDHSMMKLAVIDLCQDILKKHENVIAFVGNLPTLLFYGTYATHQDITSKAEAVLHEISHSIKHYYKKDVSVGIGSVVHELYDIRYSCHDAHTALDYRMIVGRGKIIIKSDVEKNTSGNQLKIQDLLKGLTNRIKFGMPDEALKELDKLFMQLQCSNISIGWYKTFLFEAIATIIRAFNALQTDPEKEAVLDFSIFEKLLRFKNPDDIKVFMRELLINLSQQAAKLRQDDSIIQVARAKQFIEDHYHDKALNLQEICRSLHLSTSYFSKIFKSETGETFIEYLTRIRMEKAKSLIRNTALKSYEIAERIGYEDPHYFSYSFKKHVGISPREYRGS